MSCPDLQNTTVGKLDLYSQGDDGLEFSLICCGLKKKGSFKSSYIGHKKRMEQ